MNKPNKLVNEKSPYLLQHAHNPVEWYPWGEEAFRLARKHNKPIFLSIGYSTCHWCHVMEKESFEDPDLAALMNKHFINIKVDREERPDVDAIYMSVVQALTGGGGWPMSVWLTPDLKPFYGATYFPPDDRTGRPGFRSVLTKLAEIYENDPEKVRESSQDIASSIEKTLSASLGSEGTLPDTSIVIKKAFETLRSSFDPDNGGFGRAPKFPMPVYLDFLLFYQTKTRDPKPLEMVRLTMEKIAKGGITDQLGGGFARYSTDEKWLVPHFEKMLYDNSQLISIAATLTQSTRDPFFSNLTKEAVDYVLRDLGHPEGGFYSAEDADSEGKEGAFYVWRLNGIKQLLDPSSAEMAVYFYGITASGNFYDPHTREEGLNVLTQAHTLQETADRFQKSTGETVALLDKIRSALLADRNKRPRPHRDDKILSEWNGLMISALAKAGVVLEKENYLEAARKAVRFLKFNLYDSSAKRLYRRWRDGHRNISAQQTDYAMLIQGLLDLFEVSGQADLLTWAIELQEQHDNLFFDEQRGGYFMTVKQPDLLFLMKDDGDNVIPSGNSVAALNGLRLSALTARSDFYEQALDTLRLFSSALDSRPASLCLMVRALEFESNGHIQVVLVGPAGREDTRKFKRAIWSDPLASKVVIPVFPESNQEELAKKIPWIGSMKMIDNHATAYVCQNFSCKKPTSDIKELQKQLMEFTSLK